MPNSSPSPTRAVLLGLRHRAHILAQRATHNDTRRNGICVLLNVGVIAGISLRSTARLNPTERFKMQNTIPYFPPVMSDVVIDISHYETVNQTFNNAAASGIQAVILKATQGTEFVDPTFLDRVDEARSAGLLVGAYHFLDGSSPIEQTVHFLTIAMSEAGVSWLALDWEPYPASQASVMQAAKAAASIQASTSRWPILYTIRSMLSAPNQTLSNCPLWLAEYGTRPICPPGFTRWMLWQHTDGQVGSDPTPVPGIGPCDRSKFAGTPDQLRAWWPTQLSP